MIEHNVLFRFREGLSASEIQTVGQDLLAMQYAIPEIRASSWHMNSSQEGRDKGYFYQLRLMFDDQEALQGYLENPAHVAVCEDTLFPALEDGLNSLIVFDIHF